VNDERNNKIFLTKINNYILGILLILLSLIIAGYFIYLSNSRTLSSFENTLFQIFILSISIFGGSFISQPLAEENARKRISPHAKSAFRRLISLYLSISYIQNITKHVNPIGTGDEECNRKLLIIQTIAQEQTNSAKDALEDWRDLVPDEVEELYKRFNRVETSAEDWGGGFIDEENEKLYASSNQIDSTIAEEELGWEE